MTEYNFTRVTVRFRSPEVIDTIEELPRGFKSMVIEAAMAAYLDTETGKNLVNLMIQRKKGSQMLSKATSETHTEAVSPKKQETNVSRRHINGDFHP